MKTLLGAVVGASVILLSGCGGGSAARPADSLPVRATAPAVPARLSLHTSTTAASRPESMARCRAGSLRIRAGRESDGSHGFASGNVELQNLGHVPCALSGLPRLEILHADRARLPVGYTVAPHALLQRVVLPVATSWTATMDLVWSNWCGARPGPLRLRIVLPRRGGVVIAGFNGPPAFTFTPTCLSRSHPSTMQLEAAYLPRSKRWRTGRER